MSNPLTDGFLEPKMVDARMEACEAFKREAIPMLLFLSEKHHVSPTEMVLELAMFTDHVLLTFAQASAMRLVADRLTNGAERIEALMEEGKSRHDVTTQFIIERIASRINPAALSTGEGANRDPS